VLLATFFVEPDPQAAVLPETSATVMPSAAPMRAKVKTRRAISARSRRPTTVLMLMLSSSWWASGAASTGVLPTRTTYLGPRTAAAGFTARTWPTISQSNSMRTAASACFTLGGEKSRPRRAWSHQSKNPVAARE
jgi:hypothetical protein